MSVPDDRVMFFGQLSPGARVRLLLAIFFVFSPVNVLMMARFTERWATHAVLFWLVVSGGMGMLWAWAGGARPRLLPLVGVLQAAVIASFIFQWPRAVALAGARPTVEGVGAVLLIAMGYIFFVLFIRTEGARTLRLATEMALAGRIHAHLVPPLSIAAPRFEAFAVSHASGEMGGDIVDSLSHGAGADLYLADVSGHGVRAGVVMGMLKSAVRMRLRTGQADLASAVGDLNRVLADLAEPSMFATAAFLRLGGDGRVEHVLAGHLPVLHVRAGSVTRLDNESLPLGIAPDETFSLRSVRAEPGDLFVLYTDGLTEAADKQGRQFGIEGVERVVRENAARPLAEIGRAMLAGARTHGASADDQSVLLVRVR